MLADERSIHPRIQVKHRLTAITPPVFAKTMHQKCCARAKGDAEMTMHPTTPLAAALVPGNVMVSGNEPRRASEPRRNSLERQRVETRGRHTLHSTPTRPEMQNELRVVIGVTLRSRRQGEENWARERASGRRVVKDSEEVPLVCQEILVRITCNGDEGRTHQVIL